MSIANGHSNCLVAQHHALGEIRMRIPRRWTLLLSFMLFGTVLLIFKICRSPVLNQYGILREYVKNRSVSLSETRSILLWSSFFGDARWDLPDDTLGPDQLRNDLQCAVYQCELTNQHDFKPHLELFDAIVFHVAEPFPLLKPLPRRRSVHQAYVFALMESPGETKHILSDEQNFYNLTMSYRLDSDIFWPYAYLFDVQSGARVAPSLEPHWRQPSFPGKWNDSNVWSLLKTKTKMAAWFVSHCETLSRREQLVAALQQYVQVDIYGRCGPLSCARGDKRCDMMLDTDYKFFLAFENSLCVDYVTLKLYDAMERYIVPVVFGGANYTRFVPPHSYIDANRFDTVEELAEYLRFVANDVNEYMSYFWWREHYKIGQISPFCNLCARLHSSSWNHKSQIYGDIENWWFTSCRLESHIQF